MFLDVYKGRKVLITGHTGFKGSWLSAWLSSLGARMYGLSKEVPTEPSHYIAAHMPSLFEREFMVDIRDRKQLRDALSSCEPDVIFHLAAQALVRRSYENPIETFESNAIGTLNLLEAVRNCNSLKALVLITSDKCYRNDEQVWGYRETDHLGGKDPYSASKGCAELIANSYFHSFLQNGPACATVRAGNVIGGGDWAADRIIPDCAKAWQEKRPVIIRSPLATRPWQHVLEPLSGYLWLGANLLLGKSKEGLPLSCESFNFGPAADVNNTVVEVAERLKEYWDGFTYIAEAAAKSGMKECTLLKLCCDKSLAYLDWKATLSFDETLEFTAKWYRHYYLSDSKSNMYDFTMSQIKEYFEFAVKRQQAWVN